MVTALNPAITSATQWFERTLDDSANKRLSVPECFLAIDGILDLYLNVVDGLVVYPKVIEKRLMSELPFMATENIMMDAVKAGVATVRKCTKRFVHFQWKQERTLRKKA